MNETNTSATTLKLKVCASIESPPENNRDKFKHSVINTVLHILRTEDVSIEFIGYTPDSSGLHLINDITTSYDDCVYVSFTVRGDGLNPLNNEHTPEDLVRKFVTLFENVTHRHLEIDSTIVRKGERQRMIEMHSDWKLFLSHG